MDAEKLFNKLDESSIEERMETEIQKLENMKRNQIIQINKNELRELVKKELIIPYIDLRLSLKKTVKQVIAYRVLTPEIACERCKRCIKCLRCTEAAKKRRADELEMKQAKLNAQIAEENEKGILSVVMTTFTDEETLDYVLSEPPPNLKPVAIAHKKKVTVEDFNASLDNLKKDTKNLHKASEVALSLAGLAKKSVEGFQSATRKAKLDPHLYTRAQYRWKTAIHKIILQNAVAMYTEQWNMSIHNPDNHNQFGYSIEARQVLGTSHRENRALSTEGSPRRRLRTNEANTAQRFPRASFPLLAQDSVGSDTSFNSNKYNKYGGKNDAGRRLQTRSFASVCESPYFPPIVENGLICPSNIGTENDTFSSSNLRGMSRASFDSSIVSSSSSVLSRSSFDNLNNANNRSSKLKMNALDVMSARSHYTGGVSNEQQLLALREKALEHQKRVAENIARSNRRSFVWDMEQ